MRFVAIGDNCIDIYTNLELGFPGGGPVNFAVHAARAGISTSYIGAIGTDDYGDFLSTSLAQEGVDTAQLQVIEGQTAVAFVEIHDSERIFIGKDRGVREQLLVTPAVESFIQGFDLVHTTLDGRIDPFIPGWHARGLNISYDFSHRYFPEQLNLLPYLKVAFFSGQKHLPQNGEKLLRQFHALGAQIAVMTFGKLGSAAFDGTYYYFQSAIIPAKVVDTLGAGDAFQSGFMSAILSGKSPDAALLSGANSASQAITSLGGFGHARSLNLFKNKRFN